jgi:tripartite-type tricarboxylate transporter receptor subunit TctC
MSPLESWPIAWTSAWPASPNRKCPGSGGNIGAEAVAESDPDDYTLGLVQIGNVAQSIRLHDMTFDPLIDLIPVAPVTSLAILVVANAKVPANNLTELIALAKKNSKGLISLEFLGFVA